MKQQYSVLTAILLFVLAFSGTMTGVNAMDGDNSSTRTRVLKSADTGSKSKKTARPTRALTLRPTPSPTPRPTRVSRSVKSPKSGGSAKTPKSRRLAK